MKQYLINYSYTDGYGSTHTKSGYYVATELINEEIISWANHNIIGAAYNIEIISISEPTFLNY